MSDLSPNRDSWLIFARIHQEKLESAIRTGERYGYSSSLEPAREELDKITQAIEEHISSKQKEGANDF